MRGSLMERGWGFASDGVRVWVRGFGGERKEVPMVRFMSYSRRNSLWQWANAMCTGTPKPP